MNRASINVTDTDEELLLRGRLGSSQRACLAGRQAGWLLESIGLALATFTVLLALTSFWVPGALPREVAALVGATGCIWIWRLRQAPQHWLQARQDLRAGDVALAEGPLVTSLEWSWGIVRITYYRCRIGYLTFTVDQETFAQIQPHTAYRVFYAPRSGCFLGAVPSNSAPRAPELPVYQLPGLVRADTASTAMMSTPQPDPVPESAETSDTLLLTQRELAILKLIAAGYSNQAIADELFLSVNTVKMYCSGIYQKLGVRRRTEAVAVARRLQFLDL